MALAEISKESSARMEKTASGIAEYIEDSMPRNMPSYFQTEAQWAYVGYAYGTIGDSGCGLTCAAMALEYWTREQWNPLDLFNLLGNSCTVSGMNDMGAFLSRFGEFGITGERHYSIERAFSDAMDGKTVWCSVRGRLGDTLHTRHIVLLWGKDGQVYLNDPASYGNTRAWTLEELRAANWQYFYSIWKD